MAKKKTKFNVVNALHEGLLQTAQVSRSGEVRIKRTDLKKLLESTFIEGAKRVASVERFGFPVMGALAQKDLKARKAGKGKTPITGEKMIINPRPATKNPRCSFPQTE